MPEDTHRAKHTERSAELKHNLDGRLNRVIGQLKAIKGMIEDDAYCADLLMQLSAADKALQSVERIVLEDHMSNCVVQHIQDGDTSVVPEVVDLIRRLC